MKRLLFLLFLISCSSLYSQNLIQTYVDRCTGEVKVMSVPMNGSTVVAYYNRSRVFTASDFQNGTLQSWLEETYLWWSNLNPCSTNQTQQTTVQTTVQQATTQATQAATQAAVPIATPVVAPATPVAPQPTPTVNASPPPSSPAPTQSTPQTSSTPVDNSSTSTSAPTTDNGSQVNTNESTPQTDTSGTTETSTGETGTTESTTEATTTETSESQTETQQTESTSDDSGGNESSNNETESTSETQDEGGSDNETTSEDSTEETSSESESNESEESVDESSEESSEETTEESTEEETTEEETTEEESSEEETESEEEESSDEPSSEDEEEEEDSKKKTFAPPIISANVASMQNIDGTFNQTMTIGVSRSSLLGTETYAVNAMVWDNLQQFMLNGSYSRVHINDEGRVNRVYSASIGGARMFTTTMGNMGHSLTYLGKKGSVKGIALSTSLLSIEFQFYQGKISQDAILFSPALTGFWTKSFIYNPKLTVSPMVALSSPFLLHDWFNQITTWNKDMMAIIGSSFDISLTKRFKFNVGVNTIHNTNPTIPMTWNFTIGSRFSF